MGIFAYPPGGPYQTLAGAKTTVVGVEPFGLTVFVAQLVLQLRFQHLFDGVREQVDEEIVFEVEIISLFNFYKIPDGFSADGIRFFFSGSVVSFF